MRAWLAPLIGISLGLGLAGMAAVWLGPALLQLDAGALAALLRPVLAMPSIRANTGPIAANPTPTAPPAAAPAQALPPVHIGTPRPRLPPRLPQGDPTPVPGRVEDLLRPPPGATAQASGTGFFVSSRGSVITAAHVVSGCRAIRLLSQFIPPTEAELVATDPEHDIALLQSLGAAPPAQLSIGPPGRGTARLFVLGYPATAKRDVPNETWASLVNESFPHSAPLETDPRILLWMQNSEIAQGYSGGPIVDPSSGRVVGIVRAMIDARKAAVAYGIGMPNLAIGPGARPLAAMLARESVRDGVVPASFGGDGALDVARRATVHVFCWQ